jgi:hypothetical protein
MSELSTALVIVLVATLGAPILGVATFWLVEPVSSSLAITLVAALFGPILGVAMYAIPRRRGHPDVSEYRHERYNAAT